MADDPSASEKTVDTVTGAIQLLWEWLSKPEPQAVVVHRDQGPELEPEAIETEGEAL